MTPHEYVPVDRIFTKMKRDYGIVLAEGDGIEWLGEALEHTMASKEYEEAVAIIEVKNHQCDIPLYNRCIIQVANDNQWTGPTGDYLCPSKVEPEPDSKVGIPVALDCNGMPIHDYEVAYYRPYFDFRYSYFGFKNRYGGRFTPVRLANTTLYNSLVCRMNDDIVYPSRTMSGDEYSIIGTTNKVMRFNFKEGSVAVAYIRQRIDEETGYPLIPDHTKFSEAICRYIIYKISTKEFYSAVQGADGRMVASDRDWQWYCKQAKNYSKSMKTIDEWENFTASNNYILPRRNLYDNFFGHLNRAEVRNFNDPGRRYSTRL